MSAYVSAYEVIIASLEPHVGLQGPSEDVQENAIRIIENLKTYGYAIVKMEGYDNG